MYAKYTTKAIVLKRTPAGDSAYVHILTRDFGLIIARAQGVRTQRSRLKGVLQEYALLNAVLVRTKAGWKLVTALGEKNYWSEISKKESRKVIARISRELVRLITGEEKNTLMFDLVLHAFNALHDSSNSFIEIITMFRILSLLGYVTGYDELAHDPLQFSSSLDKYVQTHKSSIVKEINRGISASQL